MIIRLEIEVPRRKLMTVIRFMERIISKYIESNEVKISIMGVEK